MPAQTDLPFLASGARTLILNGLAQTDIDMDFHRLLNLDISNIPFPPPVIDLPPTIVPTPRFWIDGWDQVNQAWHISQPSYNDLVLPTAPLNLNNQRITFLGDPQFSQDAMNMRSVTGLINAASNLAVHAPCVAATTTEIELIALQVIDGVQLNDGDRVLVKNQTLQGRQPENRIYIAHPAEWTPAPDMANPVNNPNQFANAYTFITGGNTQANTAWVQIIQPPYTLTTGFVWVLFSVSAAGGGQNLVAGNGLNITGNLISAVGTLGRISVSSNIDIDAGYIGQTSITTLGTINVGVWQGNVIAGQYGGTGASNIGRRINVSAGDFSILVPLGADGSAPLTIELTGPTTAQLMGDGQYWPIPNPSGHQGQFVSTDGSVLNWATPSSGGTGVPGQLPGTTTNDNALPGNVGEYFEARIQPGTGPILQNGVPGKMTDMQLGPGDWDLDGQITFSETQASVVSRSAAINTTPILPTSPVGEIIQFNLVTTLATINTFTLTLPRTRITVPSGTTYTAFAVAQASFSAGSIRVSGKLIARRIR